MHHFFPSFIYKQMIGEKNRYHTIEKLDESYNPNDNVCKLRILYHVLAHYYLAKSMVGTVYEYDSLNAFCTLINDYSRPLNSYTLEEVKEIGILIEENTEPNQIDHYVTQSERKEMYNKQQKEYKEKWNEEHKEEIEERKRKQREYAKQKREEYKNYMKNKKQGV
jgi:threonine aldolase